MKMKKYIAPTMPQAMKKVREELGEEAVIVSSKVVHSKGMLGLFKKKQFEVVAGLNQVEKKASLPDFPKFAVPRQKPSYEKPVQQQKERSDQILKELDELKALLRATKRKQATANYPEPMQKVIAYLEKQELDEGLIAEICDELFAVSKQNVTQEDYMEYAKSALMQKIVGLQNGGISFKKKYVNILGPTGVGKTTTIAKIAARAVLEHKKKVAFITTDTYRIGAVEQLKTYAQLLQAPIEVVYTREDFANAVQKFAKYDFVLIDTAGRNYKEEKYIDDLKGIIDFSQDIESYLVLSLTAKQHDMEIIIEQFINFSIEKIIFTKIDETNSIGPMVNLMVKYNKGLAYYANGQEVPEDIEEGSASKIIELLFRGE